MRDDVRDVCELLLEVALIVLQPLEQLPAVRKRAAEEEPSASAPEARAAVFMVVMVVHCHLLSSYRRMKRSVR